MDIYLTLIYFFCSLLNLAFGIATLIFNHKSKLNKSFFLFTVSQAFWIISLYFLYYSINPYNPLLSFISLKAAYGFSLLMSALFTVFIYYFPRKIVKFSKKTKISFIIISTIVILLTVFTPWVYEKQIIINNAYQDDVFGPLYLIYILFLLIQLIIALTIGIKKLIHLQGIDKKKMLIVLTGIGTFGLLAVLVNVILPAFEIYIFYRKTILFSLFFLIPAFYSIQKHRFFNISYVSLEFVRNFILISIFMLTAILVNRGILFISPNIHDVINLIISIGFALIIWVSLQKLFPQLIIGDFAKFKKNINSMQNSIYLCEKFNELQETLEKYFIIDQNISSVKIFAIRKEYADINLPIYVRDKFTNNLKKYKNDVLIKAEIDYKKIHHETKKLLSDKMNQLDAALCLPLYADQNLIGLFILGPKEKNQLYTNEEINEIMKLRSPLQVCLTNFLLKLNLQEENNLMKEIIENKTEKLREQFEEIKILLEQQSDFIAVTAHEFRTPLSIAMFQLEDTLSTHKHTPQVIEDMEVMSDSLNNLKNLTQKLFDVQQYDLNKIKLNKKKTAILEYLKHIYNEFNLVMKEKEIKFEFVNNLKKETNIEIDEQQIRQILSNLLNNAIKFTNRDKPEIFIEIAETDDSIQISVIDNGAGISDKDKERIFEKFQTTKTSMGAGIGLGLYICKKIIELHESKIWAEDNKNGGAKLIFELRK